MRDPGHRVVPCRCDCGTERNVLVFNLRQDDAHSSASCGCWRREQTARLKPQATHGRAAHGAKDPLYQLWARIKKRCYSPGADNYRWYGGRGIAMHEAWRTDAGAFCAWIEEHLGPRPDGMTLDRKNPDGNYEPGNLRWATWSQQRRNRSTAERRTG